MPQINQLPPVTSLSGGDNFPLWAPDQGDARRVSLTNMKSFVLDNNNVLTAASYVAITATNIASLPTAAAAGAGARATVNDSNATLTAGIGAVVAAGGANVVPVFSDGTNWRIG